MKKNKSLKIYAAVVGIALAYAVYDFVSIEKKEKATAEAQKISKLSGDQISKIQITKPDQKILMEKTVDGWKMKEPYQDLANNAEVESFIEGIITEKHSAIAAEGDQIQFEKFGLDRPQAEILIETNSGEKEIFKIGQLKNFQGDSYLQFNQLSKVFVASSTWFSKSEKTAMDFRDRRLMRLSNSKTAMIEISNPKGKMTFQKNEDRWVLNEKSHWKLDQNKVRELLNKLNITEAVEFIGEGSPNLKELASWGFNKDVTRVRIFDENKKLMWKADLATGPDKVGRAIVDPPAFILKLSPGDLNPFANMTAPEFRDQKEPFQFDPSQISSFEILFQGKNYSIKKEEISFKQLVDAFEQVEVDQFDETMKVEFENKIIGRDAEGKSIFDFQWSKSQELKDKIGMRIVVMAKSSLYPHQFSMLESEINLLKLEEILKGQKSDEKN